MPTTTANGIVKPASDLEPANGYGALVALADSVESLVQNAWIATYVPTVTAGSGTFTSASATSRYKKLGSVVIAKFTVTITTNGTAAGGVHLTLPVAALTTAYVGTGRGNGVSGKQLQAITVGTSALYIFNYDGTHPGANGESLEVTIVYETSA